MTTTEDRRSVPLLLPAGREPGPGAALRRHRRRFNPAAPLNTFSHARQLADASDTFVTINNDTRVLDGVLDLSVGPAAPDVPATGDRYYVLQFVDAWTNNIAYVGTRATGNGAGTFISSRPAGPVTSPTASGSTPRRPCCRWSAGSRAMARTTSQPSPRCRTRPPSPRPTRTRRPPPASPARRPGVADEIGLLRAARILAQRFPKSAEDAAYAARFAPLGVDRSRQPVPRRRPDRCAALAAGLAAGKRRWRRSGVTARHLSSTAGPSACTCSTTTSTPFGSAHRQPRWKWTNRPPTRFARAPSPTELGLWGNNGYEAVTARRSRHRRPASRRRVDVRR